MFNIYFVFYNLFMNFLKHQSVTANGGAESSQIPPKKIFMCSEDEQKSDGFGTT